MFWRPSFSPFSLFVFFLVSCASTEIVESPKTAFVADTATPKELDVIWTSRAMVQDFDFLGQVKVRSWTYEGAIDRLISGGRELKADALIDIHYERVGFLDSMQAFAIKYK